MGLSAMPSGRAVAAWQMDELARTLAWARGASPFHARRLDGVDCDDLRGPEDLARLPRMDASDLAAPGLLAVSQDTVARVVSLPSSGSSGPAKRLSFSEADLARTLDFFAVGMRTLCRPGDVALVLLPGRRENGVGDLLARALPEFGARAVAAPEGLPPGGVPAFVAAQGACVLVAAPSQLRRLLALPAAGLSGLRKVLASGEPLPDELRRAVESAWGCEVFDHWGMTETGYGGGVECAAHSGCHLREADLLVEVADPRSGGPLPPGAVGEILVTTLGPRALPLVRYRTGDAAAMLPGPCPCGSRLRRLGPVRGRWNADASGLELPAKGWLREWTR
jgi:phenylacetate-coenzyme A ligase PaaK-like adenylate-forming protein